MWLTTVTYSLALAVVSIATDPRLLARSDLGYPDPTHGFNQLNIINATPYRFRRFRVESYQVPEWNANSFKEWIEPDEQISVKLNIDGKDSNKHFTIHLQGHAEDGYNLEADVRGGLVTAGHVSDQKPFRFIFYEGKYGRSDTFVLAGDEKHGYTTVAPPVDWMNAMHPNFKQLAIRNIVMPASHDAGASSVKGGAGGTPPNVQTQEVEFYGQLERGIRYFDARPYIDCRGRNGCRGEQWQLGHFNDGETGGFGQSVLSMVNDINRFNQKYPGELIILDMTDGGPFRHIGDSIPITQEQIKEFIDQIQFTLAGINHKYTRTTSDSDFELAAEPLSTFYSNGQRSPIFILFPKDFNDPRIAHKGAKTFSGFLAADMLPVLLPSYSTTPVVATMRQDQYEKFLNWGRNSRSRNGKWGLWLSAFTLTSIPDIQDASWAARDVLYDNIWNWSKTANGPPNFLSVDFVKDGQIAALAMALNIRFPLRNTPGW